MGGNRNLNAGHGTPVHSLAAGVHDSGGSCCFSLLLVVSIDVEMRDFPIVTDQKGLSCLETSEEMHDRPARFDAVGGLKDEASSFHHWIQNSAPVGSQGRAEGFPDTGGLGASPCRPLRGLGSRRVLLGLEPSTLNH